MQFHPTYSPFMLEKHGLYRIQNTRSGKLTDLLHSQLITCTMKISEFKNKRAYLGAVKFKTKDQKYLGILLIFTLIPLMPKKYSLSINLYICVQGRIRQWLTLTYTPFHSITKFYMFLSLWAFLLGFSMWLGVGPKGINKTLAPMGFGPFCQLLTSPKLPLIIFNTTI